MAQAQTRGGAHTATARRLRACKCKKFGTTGCCLEAPVGDGATAVDVAVESMPKAKNGYRRSCLVEYSDGGFRWEERPPLQVLREHYWGDTDDSNASSHHAGDAQVRWILKGIKALGS